MVSLARELEHLASLLEAKTKKPRGLKHPRHAQHVAPARKRIKAVLVHFFERQRAAVLKAVKPHIARHLISYPVPVREATSTQGRTFASSLLPHSLQPLSFAATGAEESAYNDAITTLIGAAAKSLDASAAVGEDFAGEYLRDNSLSKLAGGINETSIERLQDALAGAWDKGGDYDSMVKAVTDTFDDFSTTRTELIAQTEANDAYNDGRHSIAIGLDMDEKRWDPDGTAACEEICQPNADQGWIPIDEDFQSGDDAPSGHPRCDCSTDYRKSSE